MPTPSNDATLSPTRGGDRSTALWRDAKVVVALLAGKWVLDILSALYRKPHRYSDLRRSLSGVKEKVLTETLTRMARHGLVARTTISTGPPAVGWALTPLGRSLVVPVAGMAAWTVKHRADAARGRAAPVLSRAS